MRVLRHLRDGGIWRHLGFRVAAVVLLGVLPVLGVLVLGNVSSREDAREVAREDAVRVRGLVAGQEERLLDGVRQTLAALSTNPAIRSGDCSATLASVTDEHPHVLGMLVTDVTGEVTCASRPLPPGTSLAGRPFLDDVVSSGTFSEGEYVRSPVLDRPALRTGYPVVEGGEVTAVVVAVVEPAWVVAAGIEAGMPETARLALVARDGTVLARHPDPEGLVGTDISDSPALQAALRAGTGVVQTDGADGVERIWAFAPLGDPRWPAYLQVGYDVGAVEAPAARQLRDDLVLAAIVTVAALAAAYGLSVLLLRRPIDRLLTATRRLSAGDLTARSGAGGRRPRGGGEIAELGASFDAMAQVLQGREADLRAAEARFRAAFDHAPTGMLLATVLEGSDGGRVVGLNTAMAGLVGGQPESIEGRSVLDLYHPDDHAAILAEHVALASGAVEKVDSERRLVRLDGAHLWVRRVASIIPDAQGRPAYVIAQLENVTERREAIAELSYRATHDALTGLPNRALAFDRIEHAQALCERTGTRLALLFCDLDRFKAVNDSYGHAAGDALLRVTASRLLSVVRETDTAARFAGDEFVVCAEGLPADPAAAELRAVELAHRVQAAISRPVRVEGHVLHPGVSIGVVVPEHPGVQVSDLVSDADAAMYAAKRFGTRVQVFTPPLREHARERLELEADLHEVLHGGGGAGNMTVHYQPIVDLRDGRVTAAEALVRWQHPVRGLLAPGAFLEVAEETGLITLLGERVLEQVAADQACWAGHDAPLRVTVNVSARQLAGADLAGAVERCLRDNPMGAGGISLEITETTLVRPTDATRAELDALRTLGVTLGVDDFGTGYASLSALRQLPVGFVKIDRSFVAGITENRADAAVVQGVLAMAAGMDLTVIAEGVETPEQYERLRELGCTLVQGYWTGRPMSADDLAGVRLALGSADAH